MNIKPIAIISDLSLGKCAEVMQDMTKGYTLDTNLYALNSLELWTYQRKSEAGWVDVDPEFIEHYRLKGQKIRPVYLINEEQS